MYYQQQQQQQQQAYGAQQQPYGAQQPQQHQQYAAYGAQQPYGAQQQTQQTQQPVAPAPTQQRPSAASALPPPPPAQPKKCVDRAATLAFSPTAPYVAAGTMAGAIDMSFTTSSTLEIFKVDFDGSTELPLAGAAVPAPERFHRLAWGTTGIESETHSLGIIAGGLVDGTVLLYDPSKVVGTATSSDDANGDSAASGAVVAKLNQHTSAVRGLEFNSFSPNLLASGAADNDLCIWDVANVSSPSLYPALKGAASDGAASVAGAETSFLAWNRKVQHILASTSTSGTTVVWDLKRQKPVISFSDPSMKRRCSALQWNPDVATQLVVASDDDRSPSLQVWDLRNSISPLKELHGHHKGVLSMAWGAPGDPNMLLTSGKDNRTLCWDMSHGSVVAESSAGSNWNFDVRWSPLVPGILSTASFDGKVCMYNLEDFGPPPARDGQPAPQRQAPKWLKRPCGATFGFGGKLASFTNVTPPPQPQPDGTMVAQPTRGIAKVHSVSVTDGMNGHAATLKDITKGGDREALRSFCASREAAGADDSDTWAFLRMLFEDDGRRKLLAYLGYEPPAPEGPSTATAAAGAAADAGGDTSPGIVPTSGSADNLANGVANMGIADGSIPTSDGSDFFDNYQPPTPPAAAAAAEPAAPADEPASKETAAVAPPAPEPELEADDEVSKKIRQRLVVGDYEAAVKECLGASPPRYADALVLAAMGGPELYASAADEYRRRNPSRSYLLVAQSVAEGKLSQMVHGKPPSQWKETLSLLCTYAPSDEWAGLCDALADRLLAHNMTDAAVLCYLCAGSVDAAVRVWSAERSSALEKAGKLGGCAMSIELLKEVSVKAAVFAHASSKSLAECPSLARVAERCAFDLADHGSLGEALDILEAMPGGGNSVASVGPGSSVEEDVTAVAAVRERISRVLPPTELGQRGVRSVPVLPYTPVSVQVAQASVAKRPTPISAPTPADSSMGELLAADATPTAVAAPAYSTAAPSPAAPAAQPSYAAAQPAPAAPQAGYGMAAQQPQRSPAYQPQQPQQPAAAPQQFQPQQPAAPQHFQPQQPAAPQHFQPQQPAAAPQQFQPQQPAAAPQQFQPQQPAAPQQFQPQQQAAPQQFQAQQPAAPQQFQAQPAAAGPPPSVFSPPPTAAAAAAPPPAQAAPATPPPPPGPPANVSITNVDQSKVPPELKGVAASLRRLFDHVSASAGPAKRRETEDTSKKLGALMWKMNEGQVSSKVAASLMELGQAIDAGDFQKASAIQVALTTSDWDECGPWLTALKRLLKAMRA